MKISLPSFVLFLLLQFLCLNFFVSSEDLIGLEELEGTDEDYDETGGSTSGDGDYYGDEAEEEEEEEDSEYFYFHQPDVKNNVIIEYEAPPEGQPDKPDFIYESIQIPRVVEFYAHWCPHCQHFRNHYVQFAHQLKNVASRYGIHIGVHAVSCVPHAKLCQSEGITSYPRVKLYQKGSTNGTFVNYWDLHPFQVLRSIGIEINDEALNLQDIQVVEHEEQYNANNQQDSINNDNNDNNHNKRSKVLVQGTTELTTPLHYLPRTKQDIYNDAYLSFDFMMKNGIFMTQGPLKNSTLKAFDDMIQTLQSALPPTWRLQALISDIVTNFDSVIQSEEALLKVVNRHPPKRKTWSKACTRGEKYAGYTCGLWELFHIMSIGFVEWNNFVTGDDWSYFRPEEIAVVLRNFIEHFFGCEVCRLNFLHAFDTCALDRCNRLKDYVGEESDWKEFALWLFETHNAVNVRLMKERAQQKAMDNNNGNVELYEPTRQDEFNVMWPPRQDCPQCWHADGRWDDEMIYIYLRLTYWPEDDTAKEYRKILQERYLQMKGLEQYYNNEDDEFNNDAQRGGILERLLVMFPCIVALFGCGSWYWNRLRLRKTGRHKKVDY